MTCFRSASASQEVLRRWCMAAGVVCPGDVLCAAVRSMSNHSAVKLRDAWPSCIIATHHETKTDASSSRRTLQLGQARTSRAQTSAPLSSARSGRRHQTRRQSTRCNSLTWHDPHDTGGSISVLLSWPQPSNNESLSPSSAMKVAPLHDRRWHALPAEAGGRGCALRPAAGHAEAR